MKRFKLLLIISALLFSAASFARVNVKNVNLVDVQGNKARIAIDLDQQFSEVPEVMVRDGILQVAMPKASVWPKIEKKVDFIGSEMTLMAYQYDKNLARFRALLPYTLVGLEDKISVQVKDKKLVVDFPVINTPKENFRAPVQKVAAVQKTAVKEVKEVKNNDASKYDEAYLESLLKEKSEIVKVEDTVSTSLSATEKQTVQNTTTLQAGEKMDGASYDLISMIGKFAGFLCIVIGLFFGIVHIFKRNVLAKGKLGFLNSTDVVQVLNTTYIAPKKSLLLVKVHNQVFLLSNDEHGMSFLSEVSDVTGLLKNGEQKITGSNFDTTLEKAEVEDKPQKIKEDIFESTPVADAVKFSDQIKNKVKNLKALQ